VQDKDVTNESAAAAEDAASLQDEIAEARDHPSAELDVVAAPAPEEESLAGEGSTATELGERGAAAEDTEESTIVGAVSRAELPAETAAESAAEPAADPTGEPTAAAVKATVEDAIEEAAEEPAQVGTESATKKPKKKSKKGRKG
jgi:hypothetical protein